MKKSLIYVSASLLFFSCSDADKGKEDGGKGWKVGQNNEQTNNRNSNNVTNENNVKTTNNVTTSLSNNLTSNNRTTGTTNNRTTGSNNETSSTNNGTTNHGTSSTNNGTTGVGDSCQLNSECSGNLFCCPDGFQGAGKCASSCDQGGGKCGGNHDECGADEGCCPRVDVCSPRCAENPAGMACTHNPDCQGGELCCPNFNGGPTCAADCGLGGRVGGVCLTDTDCGGATATCCPSPIGNDKICLAKCGF